ncbi:hypothetical protein [Niveibacterium sp.]
MPQQKGPQIAALFVVAKIKVQLFFASVFLSAVLPGDLVAPDFFVSALAL